jgi:hypothetical protein
MFGGRLSQTTSREGFISAADLQKHKNLAQYYGEKRPNAVLTGLDTTVDLKELTGTYLGETNQFISPLKTNYALPNNSMSGDLFAKNNQACVTAGGGSSAFKRLSYLADNVDPKQKMRCGWVYNNENPEQGGGAYGNRDGPIDTNFKGEWYWNLADAKQKYHKLICSRVTDCGDLGGSTSPYAQICGFCTSSKKGIPISGSIAAYPFDPRASCAPSAIVTSADKCPRPKPQMSTAAAIAAAGGRSSDTPAFTSAAAKALNACDPFANGRLPRQCLIKKAQQVGCTEDGALVTSLKSGSEDNYLSELTKVPSYAEYQKRTDNAISEQSLKQGSATLDMILAQFQGVKDHTASSTNIGLQAAAQDLCIEAGSFEAFDFCIEFKDTDYTPSIPLDCLQKEFLRGGGQKTGTLYPTKSNLSYWRKFSTWKDFKNQIESLGTRTLNTVDRLVQQDAIKKLQGIPIESLRPSLGDAPGVEVFWFSPEAGIKSTTTYNGCFLGRRIRSNIPTLAGDSTTPGFSKNRAGFVYFTNVKPEKSTRYNMQFTGDSGFIVLKNQPMLYNYSSGSVPSTDKEFSALYDTLNVGSQMSTSQTGGPWTFDPAKVNILQGYYFGQGSQYSLKFMEETGVDPACGCYGKPSPDNYIRAYTNAECNLLGGNFYSSGECIIKTGGSYSWNCRGLNTQIPCKNQWGPIPDANLFLIQETFAPMISFVVDKNFARYNSPTAFLDKRFGSHKMTWGIWNGAGPTWNFPGPAVDENKFPLGMSYGTCSPGSGLLSNFSLKRYSFMTLVLIARFTTLPTNGQSYYPFILFPVQFTIDNPYIKIVGNADGTASMNMSTKNDTAGTKDGPTIKPNITYFITIRMNRSNDSDIYSLNSIQIGAAPLVELQDSAQSFMESTAWVYPNPKDLENPDSPDSCKFLITGNLACVFDLFTVQLYDYRLEGANLVRAANNDWYLLDGNVFT